MDQQDKLQKKYYSIGEVAKMLNINQSKIRYWQDEFPEFIKPRRGRKGDRRFTPKDIEVLKTIIHLINEKGMKLDGVRNYLKYSKDKTDAQMKVIRLLEDVKEKLENIRKSLD